MWALDATGKSPGKDYFDALDPKDRAKSKALFDRLAERGRIHGPERFKKLDDRKGRKLFEFKSFQIRFIGAFAPGNRFVVAVGLKKKKDRHNSGDLERAARILNEHFSSRNPHGPR